MNARYRIGFHLFALCLFSVASPAQEPSGSDHAGPEQPELIHPRDRFSTTPQRVTPGFDGDAPADELIQSGDRPRELVWPPLPPWRNDR